MHSQRGLYGYAKEIIIKGKMETNEIKKKKEKASQFDLYRTEKNVGGFLVIARLA